MTWEYALTGLMIGIIIGVLAMRFGTHQIRQHQTLRYELEKSQAELDEYRKELTSHFARSAELLNNIADSYRQLYQHMAKSSNSLLPNQSREDNPFHYALLETETVAHEEENINTDVNTREGNDKISAERQPRDYPEITSGLLRTNRH
ncbi:Z-ring associated protein ZapG [Candidatus Steffania adelgidicola]|uniref:Z-ring associated protein ZapG n=1 Tax=Candidatus Steffania adelgidicola TaxID=1076626 RepID=UPI001D007C2E|nr:Z-ring associated protein ZapG [Candidatus Steffania adelgidicola]UDG80174.1 Inner membrane protein YhcB [Candidatus Steffania adelgidicola]